MEHYIMMYNADYRRNILRRSILYDILIETANRNCSAHKENILFYSILRTPKTAMKREL